MKPNNSPPPSPSISRAPTPDIQTEDQVPIGRVTNPSDTHLQGTEPSVATRSPLKIDSLISMALYKSGLEQECNMLDLSYDGLEKPELEQIYTNKSNDFTSPESEGKGKNVGDEPIRSLLRHQRLLLLKSDTLLIENHKIFTAKQPDEIKLTFDSFKALQNKFKLLSDDQWQVAKVTAVLKPSTEKIKAYEKSQCPLPKDAEEILTEIASLASGEQEISFMPAIDALSKQQRKILEKAYPESAHFRHFLFAENGLKELSDGVNSIKKLNALDIWEARWLVDLMGFDRNQYGISQPLFDRVTSLFSLIKDVVEGKKEVSCVMPEYLKSLQKSSGLADVQDFNGLNSTEQTLVTQMVAYFENTSSKQCKDIVQGFLHLPEEIKQSLTKYHAKFLCNSEAKSPTYLPAVLKTGNEKFEQAKSKAPLQEAASYTFKMLNEVYKAIAQNPDRIISARNAAFGPHWDKNEWAKDYLENKIHFSIDEAGEIKTKKL